MSKISEQKIGLGDVLFSRTQRQVLSLLFGHSDKSFYLNEIVRFAGVGIGSVQRELEKLSEAGLLTTKKIGNQKHYQANRTSPIFDELQSIVRKTFGVGDVLRNLLAAFSDKIVVAFIYGSIAKQTDTASSDIDILLIGEGLSYSVLLSEFANAEKRLGRKISPNLYTPAEFVHKISDGNNFLNRILDLDKIFLVGEINDIPKP